MFASLAKKKLNLLKLHQTIRKTYIERHYKKPSIFEKSDIKAHHIPYKKAGKYKRQEQWDNPDYNWPPKFEIATIEENKKLLSTIEKEEVRKLKCVANYQKVPVRLGDKIEVEYYLSITSNQKLNYTGIVLGTKNRNSITSSFRFLTNIKGTMVELNYMYYSPMLASIKVLNRSYTRNKSTMFNYRNIIHYGFKLLRLLKGGKNFNMTKKIKKDIYKKVKADEVKDKTVTFEN